MFAVIKASGRQFRVAAGDVIEVNRMPGEVGDRVDLADVLMVGGAEGTTVGVPLVEGATVAGEVVEHRRGPKILIFKKRRRKNSRRLRGHRQELTLVRITDILTGGAQPKPRAAARTEKAETSTLTPLFAAPEGEPNDLKQIAGVGPVLEGKLNALGITRFDQIAAFSSEDVAKVDEALHFKGRIEREDWIGQAKALAAETGSEKKEG